MLAAGKLNHLIQAQINNVTQNALNEDVDNWVDYKRIWTNVKIENGSEFYRANRESTEIKGSIRMRPRNDITAQMRFLYKGMVLNIISPPLPDESNEFMDIAVSTKAV